MGRVNNTCASCKEKFKTKKEYLRHLELRAGNGNVCPTGRQTRHARRSSAATLGSSRALLEKKKCPMCKSEFARVDSLKRHLANFHPRDVRNKKAFACGICKDFFSTRDELIEHRDLCHQVHHDFRLQSSSHNGQVLHMRAFFPKNVVSPEEALFYTYNQCLKFFIDLSKDFKCFKINLIIALEMVKFDDEGEIATSQVFYFAGQGLTFTRFTDDVRRPLAMSIGDMERAMDVVQHRGSGWLMLGALYIDAFIVECEPLRGATCQLHTVHWRRNHGLELRLLKDSDDGMCFYNAVAQAILGLKAPLEVIVEFVSNNMRIGPVPMPTSEVAGFEQDNAHLDLGINVVYFDEDNDTIPIVATRNLKAKNMVALALSHTILTDENGENPRNLTHYGWMPEPEKVLAKRPVNEESGKVRTSTVHICWNCGNLIKTKGGYESHVEFCHQNKCQRVIMPAEGETRSFLAHKKASARSFKSAFMVFYDFESLQVIPDSKCSCSDQVKRNTEKVRQERLRLLETTEQEMFEDYLDMMDRAHMLNKNPPVPSLPKRGRRLKVCHHKEFIVREQPPFNYCFVVVDRDMNVLEQKVYTGMDAAENFILSVLNVADKYLPTLSPGKPMDELEPLEKARVLEREWCYICHNRMAVADRVLDHDHLTGEILGVAHNRCNLMRREQHRLTCFAHNFSGYDSHFLIKVLNKFPERITKIRSIPINTQKFKSITINDRIQFLDSFSFLTDGLSTLVDILNQSESPFPLTSTIFPSPEDKALMLRKGVYPYSFASSISKLQSQKTLPNPNWFYNELTDEPCKLEDYKHAQKVWEHFRCKNMLMYTNLYVRADTFLLADSVTNFRQMVWDNFGLDMCQYLSLPHLAMDIMLKETKVVIDLVHDQEMQQLLERNIRGGVSYANLRHSKKVSREEVEKDEDERSLIYVDANNLYGHAMRFPLPVKDFKWMTRRELAAFDPAKHVTNTNGTGYILEVDLEYPGELHLPHNSYPLAPEHIDIDYQMLGEYSKHCLNVNISNVRKTRGGLPKYESRKLGASLRSRKKYLVHGLNLKLYLELGLKLTKIHRGIKFTQLDFMRSFVERCTEMRMKAKTAAEQNLWKLICNSVYGKLIEAVSKRMDAFFDTTREASMKHCSSPLYKGSMVCSPDLSISFLQKKAVVMRQSHIIGFSVLEVSKYIMQSLYYNEIVPKLDGNVSVVMSDTDSFLLEVRGMSELQAMIKLESVMDFSNYDRAHPLYSSSRKKIPGFLKNEMPGRSILEAIAVKAKVYAYRTDTDVFKKVKGVTSGGRKSVNFDMYKQCVEFNPATVEVEQLSIRSKNHINRLVHSRKVAFTSFDDKRYQMCQIHSVPYGSNMINEYEYRISVLEEDKYLLGKKFDFQEACVFCEEKMPGHGVKLYV